MLVLIACCFGFDVDVTGIFSYDNASRPGVGVSDVGTKVGVSRDETGI